MPTWGGILKEIHQAVAAGGPVALDAIRRRYLAETYQHTGRAVILYATKWTDPNVSPDLVSIVDEDLQGLMEVVHRLSGPNLDLILHSPGGSAEAAERMVSYLRSKFDHIRVVVPQQAMSAATLVACAADVIVMGKHSFLGPTDPQFILPTPQGVQVVPAQAILDQFELAKKECSDPSQLGAWLPMLGQYGPGLLVQCQNASAMSQELVRRWLRTYMFRESSSGSRKATKIARWLSDHRYFKSHSRAIPRDELKRRGLVVEDLEADQRMQDLFLSVFHATTHTFNMTGAAKIIRVVARQRSHLPSRPTVAYDHLRHAPAPPSRLSQSYGLFPRPV